MVRDPALFLVAMSLFFFSFASSFSISIQNPQPTGAWTLLGIEDNRGSMIWTNDQPESYLISLYDGQIEGFTACQSIAGSYKADSETRQLEFVEICSIPVGTDAPQNQSSEVMIDMLRSAAKYDIQAGVLRIISGQNQHAITFAALDG
jgi:hypothetical protein